MIDTPIYYALIEQRITETTFRRDSDPFAASKRARRFGQFTYGNPIPGAGSEPRSPLPPLFLAQLGMGVKTAPNPIRIHPHER